MLLLICLDLFFLIFILLILQLNFVLIVASFSPVHNLSCQIHKLEETHGFDLSLCTWVIYVAHVAYF